MKKTLIVISIFVLSFIFLSLKTDYPEKFNKIMESVLLFEGGYTDIDPGGTNMGVTQETYDIYRTRKHLKTRSVKFITMDEVYDCYYKKYYLTTGCDTLPPATSFVNMDVAVNSGIGKARIFLATILSENPDLATNLDSCDKQVALKYIEFRMKERYNIVARNEKKRIFLKGWLNRDKQVKNIIEKNY